MNISFLLNDKHDINSGVGTKIFHQAIALKKQSCNFYFIKNSPSGLSRIINDKDEVYERGVFHPLLLRYRFKNLFKYIISCDTHVLYIRYTHFSSPGFIDFIRRLKDRSIKIVLEFPTFPYDDEYLGLRIQAKIKLLIDKMYRKKISNYIDFCVSFTSDSEIILGMEVLQLSNAVDASLMLSRAQKVRCLPIGRLNDALVFTAVASMHYWHGYDRLIYSISNYLIESKNPIKIIFNIVGEGPEQESLKRLVENLKCEKNVIFHGYLKGERLDNILLNTDMGVDSLARFRSGNESNNSLKSKEYLSFGLPVIKSHVDNSIDDLEVIFNVSHNENKIDLYKIINWYNNKIKGISRIDVVNICIKRFTWDIQMKKIINKIDNG